MQLHTIWFVILAIFWVGFFVLEGFDFGVGMLHTIVGRTDEERKRALSTIGPWWDGNEVWLIVAGAGTFAAFPGWYATMFSALYLALLLVLLALMARGVSFEFKDKSESPRWRTTWRWAMTLGCLLIPLLLGVGLGDLLNGLPIDSSHDYTGNFFGLLTPYGLWTGVTLVALCLLHGATFLKLRTTDELRERARALARPLGWAAIALVIGWVIWTRSVAGGPDVPQPVEILAVIAVGFAARLAMTDHDGLSFCLLGGGDRRDRRLDLHRPVSQRDGLQHQRRLQPDRQQFGLRSLRACRDDGGRGDLLPAGAALPRLVVSRVPRAHAGAGGAGGLAIWPGPGSGRRPHTTPDEPADRTCATGRIDGPSRSSGRDYQASILGRRLPARLRQSTAGGSNNVAIQRRESAGSITSSISPWAAMFEPLAVLVGRGDRRPGRRARAPRGPRSRRARDACRGAPPPPSPCPRTPRSASRR